ncbi:MAG: hypothetical protein NTX61_13810 [Bacteroidetes bacterium]|nr:hypothetical protein [Bacteroidota bacterium]
MKNENLLRSGLFFLAFLFITISGCQKDPNDLQVVKQDNNHSALLPSGAGGTIICSSAVISGAYVAGVALTSFNTVGVNVNVTSIGAYTIYTNTVNGYSFSASGNFTATGTQNVILLGTGTPGATGINTFMVTFGTSTCNFSMVVVSGAPIYSTSCGTNYVYYEVANQKTLKVWLDRNLGATRVAQSSTDYLAYGSLYQWGRLNDSHQCISWTGPNSGTPVNGTTTTKSSKDNPGNNKFIKSLTNPFDWRVPQNNNLWQGASGINNPCPAGFRIPTNAEFIAEVASWSSANIAGAFASPLKWTMAGYRDFPDGALYIAGYAGGYWSSTIANTSKAMILWVDPTVAYTLDDFRAAGYSVRPVKN